MKIMFTKKHLAVLMLTAGGLALTATSAQAALLIDGYSNAQTVQDDTSGGGSTSSGNIAVTDRSAALAGEQRNLTALAQGSGTTDIKVNQTFGPNILEINNSSASNGKATLDYTAFGPIDLTTYGTAFLLDVSTIDTGVTVDMFVSDGTNTASATAQSFSGPGVFYVTFASFTGLQSVFAGATSFQLVFTGPTAWDGTFDNFRTDNPPTVPEPASIALMGLGLAGLGVWRRRKA